jgi:hypothetical protein
VAEPEGDGGDDDFGSVVGDAFDVAGGETAELFEPPEAAFDDVAAPVDLLVETAAAPSASFPGGELVPAFGDGVRDSTSAQVGADLVGGITLVGDEVQRPDAWSTGAGPADPDCFDDFDQAGAIVDVAARDDKGQRQAAPVTRQVDLGGQSAAGSSERPVRLVILLPVRPGGVPFLRAPAAC